MFNKIEMRGKSATKLKEKEENQRWEQKVYHS